MDDNSPVPIAPILPPQEDIEEEIINDDDKLAQVGLHPVFGVIEQEYIEEIERASSVTSVDPTLTSVDYKAVALANAKYSVFLQDQLQRIRDAIKAKGK